MRGRVHGINDEIPQRTNLRKSSFQLPSFFHLRHPGRNRRLKHSSHSSPLRLGKVASNRRKVGDAKLRISIQLCRGTIWRTLRCNRESSYEDERRFRRMGRLQGFSEGSEAISCRRRERYDIFMRDSRSNSPKISAMSSTGRDSNVIEGFIVASWR